MLYKIRQWINNKLGKRDGYAPIPQYSDCVIEGIDGPFVLGKCRELTCGVLVVDCDYRMVVELNPLKGKSTLFLCGFVNAVAFNAVIEDWKYFDFPDEMPFVKIRLMIKGDPISINA